MPQTGPHSVEFMATLDFKPPRTKAEPELNLLLPKSAEQPLWKSLFQNLDDYFFPKKQPPLVLTSKPVPVKDRWGFHDYKKSGDVGKGVTIIGRRVVKMRWRVRKWYASYGRVIDSEAEVLAIAHLIAASA